MSNLQIARDILELARDVGDEYMTECAHVCIRAFKRGYTPPWREWAMVKAFWFELQECNHEC